jgi:hypothetical protein
MKSGSLKLRYVAAAVALLAAGQVFAAGGSVGSQFSQVGGTSRSAPIVGSLTDTLIDVTGITSIAALGTPGNNVLNINVGAGAQVVGIGWDVNVTAFTPSWLSELTVSFGNTGLTTGVDLSVGAGDDFAGVGVSYSSGGVVDLIGLGLDFAVDGDGVLRLEFGEGFDDASVDPDGIWNSGFLTVQTAVVPEPATYGMMALGLCAIGAAARRRRG